MPLSTIQQMYRDMEIVAKTHLRAQADANTVLIFNANLAEAKKEAPGHPILQAMRALRAQGDVRATNGELLVALGQVKQVLEDEEGKGPFLRTSM